MKKSILFFGLAFAAMLSTQQVNALTNDVNDLVNVEQHVHNYNVNSFCVAISKGDYDTVAKLIKLGEDVNKKSGGMTPLMYAARYNHSDIVKLLLANGANSKTKCSKGHTALKYAEMSNAKDAKAVLLKNS